MENRFGAKDLFLFLLLSAVVVVVVLAMVQYDRQWKDLQQIERRTTAQAEALTGIRRELESINKKMSGGLVVGQPSTAQAVAAADGPKDAFHLQREAMKNPDYAEGDWLINNTGAKLSKITPLLSSDVYASFVQARVLEPLAIRDDETLEWLPHLATSWTIDDRSKEWRDAVDALVKAGKSLDEAKADPSLPPAVLITLKLRPGLRFSDGKPFSADDVVFSFDWVCNEAVDAPRQRAFIKENIAAVEKVGELEVRFKFKRPYFEAFRLAAGIDILPKHFISKFTTKQFNESVGLLMGTGQYRLEDPEAWRPGKTMILVRNEQYWGIPGPFNRILFNEVENDAAELTMFRNGELDIFRATPEQYRTLKDDADVNAKANRFEFMPISGGYTYLAWNQKKGGAPSPLFADKRVRQALTHLIDRQRIAEQLFYGYATVTSGPFNPASKQNAPGVTPLPYDFERGRQLLADAGFKDANNDGVLDAPDGKTPFKFKLTYGNGNPLSERIALAVKDGLSQAGIVVDLDPTDWPIMLKKLDQKDFDAITLGWSGGAETDIFQMFHSSQTVAGGDNYMSYANPTLDGLIVEARETVDDTKRMPLWQECHRILADDQPYTFLVVRKSLLFIDKRIKNVQLQKTGMNFEYRDPTPIPWYVPRQLQKHVD